MKRRLVRALLLACTVALAACGSRLSLENFERVKEGMTQEEVVKILGEPKESSSASFAGLSGTAAVWSDGKTRINVQFFNGRVQAKQFEHTGTAPKSGAKL